MTHPQLSPAEPERELVHEERLAGAEVPEDEHELRTLLAQPGIERLQRVIDLERVHADAVSASPSLRAASLRTFRSGCRSRWFCFSET